MERVGKTKGQAMTTKAKRKKVDQWGTANGIGVLGHVGLATKKDAVEAAKRYAECMVDSVGLGFHAVHLVEQDAAELKALKRVARAAEAFRATVRKAHPFAQTTDEFTRLERALAALKVRKR
ncbi:MAG: hypothetical protein KGI71_05790 [Patescibacteria group bacterium]|nr:hypothetical protein [Patescibacteria group bacterium]